MAGGSNTGSSQIGGAGINTMLTPSSVGVNPNSKSELILNGALGNAFAGGVTGPNMQGSSGAGFNTPNSVGGGDPMRDKMKAYMGGGAFFEDEDDDEFLKKLKQMLSGGGALGMEQPQLQQQQQPINFQGAQNFAQQQPMQQSPFFSNQAGVANLKRNM